MNKYDNYENNNNRVPYQNNMAFNQQSDKVNPPRQFFCPGIAGLRSQGMPIQSMSPHIQPNMNTYGLPYNHNFPTLSNYYMSNNQICSQILNNHSFSQLPTNVIRPNAVYNQNQPSNIYHTPVEKINANNQTNYLITQNFPQIYHQPPQQIQHPISHISNQISPHIQPQHHPQMQQSQLQNPISVVQSLRQYMSLPIPIEKQLKPLEIINPETKTLIDLTSFKYEKESRKNNKIDFRDSHTDSNKYVSSCFIKDEFHTIESEKKECLDISSEKIESNENHNEKAFVETQIDKIVIPKIQINKNEYSGIELNKNEDPETNIELTIIKLPFETSQPDGNLQNTTECEPINDAVNLIITNLQDPDINNVVVKSDNLPQDIEIIVNNKHPNKFIYSREELIKIGKKTISQQKPKGLPFKEFIDPIIIENSINISGLENVESIQFVNQKFTKVHKTSQGSSISWRNLNIKNTHSFPKYINLGNTENILSKSDDGYVTCKQRLAAGEELSATEELIRQIKGILNRIVPQNFDQCLDDLVSLKIGTHEGMTCLVNELFLKAVKEEAYSVTFAKICSYLASIKADVSDHEIVTFRSVLLQKCQAMFTTPLKEQLEKVRQEWLLKASNEKPKTKALMESDVDEQIKKAKDRYYGNIRFIGELYLKGVLITKIICYCIENLLTKENDADSLICLCKLLETCGAKLENEVKGKEKLNDSFKKLRHLSESLLIETRVRFRIRDIMEMRQKQWCLRKVQQEQKIQPKTLKEIKIEKEMEEEKEYTCSLNRKNLNSWAADRRPSLPNVNKSRSNIVPRQLTVTCSNDSTTLGPQKRNWSKGSGAAINTNTVDNEKKVNKHKVKMNSDVRSKDIYGIENQDLLLTQTDEGCVSNYRNCILPIQSFSVLNYQSRNSSENSSRSSSHGRSTPQIILKEKLPNSKLGQTITIDITLLSAVELFKEYASTTEFSEESWNACPDKVEVVYQWLDSNFDTNCDNRISLSNFLSMLINQNMMEKDDLLKAFSKLIDLLEDLIIDIGQGIWDCLSDYLMPFLESMELDSVNLIESIFDFDALRKFKDKHAFIIYSLPWSMSNKIMKIADIDKCKDIFKIALATDNLEHLTSCEKKLIFIISKNLFRAIKIVTQINVDCYLNWITVQNAESFSCFSEEFFIKLNWEEMFNQIQTDSCSATRFAECFKKLSSMSKNNEILTALCKISNKSNQSIKGIYSIINCLLVTHTYDIQTVLSWESTSPSKLKHVLANIKTSAFISDNSFESLFSLDESNNFFNELTFDHDNCTNSDSY